MKIIRLLLTGLALVALHSLPASATVNTSSLNCSNAQCIEVWQFTCPSSNLVVVQIRDVDGVDDTLMVSVIATSPANIKGHADVDISTADPGFSSGRLPEHGEQRQPLWLRLVTTLSNTGPTQYALSIVCDDKAGVFRGPATFARVQDQ